MSQGPSRPRVLLADDDEDVRTSVCRLLCPSCDIVGYAADTATLLEATMRLRPDVVLLDFSLPGGLNSLQVCRRIKTMTPDVNVVAFTAHDDADLRRLASQAGVSAFVWKMRAGSDLLSTIHAVVDRRSPPPDDNIV